VVRDESSGLTEAQEVALRLADALMTQPAAMSVGLRENLSCHYRPEQVLELTLDVMKWSYQKVSVALGTDDEIAPGLLTDLAFNDEGDPSF
jgi:hypothetical protein